MQATKKCVCLLFACVVLTAACLPSHLQKYRKDGAASEASPSDVLNPSPLDVMTAAPKQTGSEPRRAFEPSQARATIYAVDKQTYRFTLRESEVWDALLTVLMRNYNLTIVDKASGIITTEWDGFYLNNAVYRNKVSVRLRRVASSSVDVTVHNNVERLRDASQTTGAVGAVWLPAEDPGQEIARIMQNMALVLNQPPPVLPPTTGAVAKATGDDSITN